MPQISRVRLNPEVETELLETFLDAVVAMNERDFAREVLVDLLTPTERVMLAKRLLIAVLIEEGYSYQAITKALKVTSTTVNSVRLTLARSGKGLRALVGCLKSGRVARSEVRRRAARREAVVGRIAHLLDMLRLPVKGSRTDMRRWKKAMGASL